MMLVAMVPLWVMLLLLAVNAVLAVEEVTEQKTDWRQLKPRPDPLADMQKRLDAALIPGNGDLDLLLKRLSATRS
jgi:hypothetical protein